MRNDGQRIPLFTPEDFHSWQFLMKIYLDSKERLGPINQEDEIWIEMTPTEQQKVRKQAFADIVMVLGRKHQHYALSYTFTMIDELWRKLEETHGGVNNYHICELASWWATLEWPNSKMVLTFFREVTEITTELAAANHAIQLVEQFTTIVNKIPPCFDVQRAILQTWEMPDVLRMHQMLLNEEHRQAKTTTKPKDQDGSNFQLGQKKIEGNKFNDNDKKQKRDAPKVECFFCHHQGYMKCDYRKFEAYKAYKDLEKEKGKKPELKSSGDGMKKRQKARSLWPL